MKNGQTIKVIKRNPPSGDAKAQAAVGARKTEKLSQKEVGSIVSSWISERRENSRIERVFSDDKISSWKKLPASPDEATG
ncbi:MAG: hypothetical protein IPK58_04115 [Acidobacteria bacterium]|nr:hypothetical protein [Acidobacteriota bacterium]